MSFPGTPTLRQGYVSSTTDSTTWAAFSNVSVPAGSLAVFFVTADATPGVSVGGSDTDWLQLYSATASTAVRGACFYWFNNTGGPVNKSFTLTAASAQQFSGILYIIPRATAGAWLRLSATTGVNSVANPNPPSHNAGAVRNHLWIAAVHSDNTNVASAAPTNYTNLTTQAGGGANGVSTYSAERTNAVQTEDPGNFTQGTARSFVAATVAIWEYQPVAVDLAADLVSQGDSRGHITRIKVSDGLDFPPPANYLNTFGTTVSVAVNSLLGTTSIPANAAVVVLCAYDGNAAIPSVTGTDLDWQTYGYVLDNSADSLVGYYWVNTTGSPVDKSLEITFSQAETIRGYAMLFDPGRPGVRINTSATLSDAGNSPIHDAGALRDHLWLAFISSEGQDAPSPVPPLGYNELRTAGPPSTSSTQTRATVAFKPERIQTEDPGAFGGISSIHASATIALWEESLSGGGSQALEGAVTPSATATGAADLAVPVSGAAAATLTASAALTTSKLLASTALASGSLTGNMSKAVALAGSVAGSGSVASDLTVVTLSGLAGAVTGSVSPNGILSLSVPVAGSASGSATVAAALSKTAALAGAATITVTSTGAVSKTAALQGSAGGPVAVTGALTHQVPLQGGAVTTASASSTLLGGAGLAGSVAAAVTTSGTLSKAAPLAGAVAVEAVALATFTGDSTVAGLAGTAATVSGALGVTKALAGAVTAATAASGAVSAPVGLSGAAGGPVAITGALDTTKPLSGAVAASVAAAAGLTGDSGLSGAVAVSSTASGFVSKVAALRSDTTIAATGLASIVLTKPLAGSGDITVTVAADLLGRVVAGDLVLTYTVEGLDMAVSADQIVVDAQADAVEVTVIGVTVQAA